jgi:hypothetical protein
MTINFCMAYPCKFHVEGTYCSHPCRCITNIVQNGLADSSNLASGMRRIGMIFFTVYSLLLRCQ